MAGTFPFRSRLDFAPLIAYWRQTSERADLKGEIAAHVIARLDAVPELAGPIDDLSVLERHQDLVSTLIAPLFPAAAHDETYSAIFTPFRHELIHATPAFQRVNVLERMREKFAERAESGDLVTLAYNCILSSLYGMPTEMAVPFIVEGTDPDTGLARYFRLFVDPRFCTAVAVGELPAVDPRVLQNLLQRRHDLDAWFAALPPERFELRGIAVLHAVDVTEQQVVAGLTSDLLQRDAMTSPEKVAQLQTRLRTLLRRPQLELGLIRIERDDCDDITGARAVGRSLLLSREELPYCCNRGESYYTRVIETREPVVVHDLECCPVATNLENHLRQQGMRNLVVAPLLARDRLVGLIEIASPQPGDVHTLNSGRLQEVLGLFATAMQRLLDDRETRVQAIIKQQYTAIHPAVEWRFRNAARNYLEALELGEKPVAEPIVFQDVYPLYGLSDIRGSSSHRAAAVQADLLEQLQLAVEVVRAARAVRPLPALAELEHRIAGNIRDVGAGLSAGDELRVLDFLRTEFEDVLHMLDGFGETTAARIAAYRDALDPQLGFLYHRRRDFEQSVALINDTIVAFIDREQAQAQEMFPHYFEKFKTDGVDYDIYVGASLQEDGRFQPIYLRNLRLWQIMLMCGIVWELNRVKPALPVPLEAAHLILVQSSPLAIRFHADEKQFDVDGAYNIRYEIVKKRIDKARLKDSPEQLTQPGRIAIVYSHPREAAEYREYIAYLRAAGYLTNDVEEVELEDLQGASGLRALRVTVAPNPPAATEQPVVERVDIMPRALATATA